VDGGTGIDIGPAIEEVASDVGSAVKSGYVVTAEVFTAGVEYTAEQLEALHKFLGDEGFYDLFGGSVPKRGKE
jgi:hypothetical protein